MDKKFIHLIESGIIYFFAYLTFFFISKTSNKFDKNNLTTIRNLFISMFVGKLIVDLFSLLF